MDLSQLLQLLVPVALPFLVSLIMGGLKKVSLKVQGLSGIAKAVLVLVLSIAGLVGADVSGITEFTGLGEGALTALLTWFASMGMHAFKKTAAEPS